MLQYGMSLSVHTYVLHHVPYSETKNFVAAPLQCTVIPMVTLSFQKHTYKKTKQKKIEGFRAGAGVGWCKGCGLQQKNKVKSDDN
jgi:hypothetical protein